MTRNRLSFEKARGDNGPGPRVKGRYKKPKFAEFAAVVKRFNKRVGLAWIYHTYAVPKKEYVKYRQLWDMVEKGLKNGDSEQLLPEKNQTAALARG